MRPRKTVQCTLCQVDIPMSDPKRQFCDACWIQRRREHGRKNYHKHAEQRKAAVKTYREANREHVLEKKRENYHHQIVLKRQKDKERYESEKERRIAYSKQFYAANREKALSQMAAKYAANPGPRRQYVRQWSQNNPEKVRNHGRVKRARKRNAQGSHTMSQFWEVCETYQWTCAYCHCSLNKSTVTEDHAIPLSRGGTDFIENIVPACRPCNSSKQARTYEEYMRLIGSSSNLPLTS